MSAEIVFMAGPLRALADRRRRRSRAQAIASATSACAAEGWAASADRARSRVGGRQMRRRQARVRRMRRRPARRMALPLRTGVHASSVSTHRSMIGRQRQVRSRLPCRIVADGRAPVPRADVLADVAAVDLRARIAGRSVSSTIVARLDGQVRQAAGRVDRPGFDDGAGRTGLEQRVQVPHWSTAGRVGLERRRW